jgi:hypothetical protein
MKRLSYISCVAAIIAGAATVRADMAPVPWSAAGLTGMPSPLAAEADPPASGRVDLAGWAQSPGSQVPSLATDPASHFEFVEGLPHIESSGHESAAKTHQSVGRLPEEPGSLSLFLSALGSLGAWQLTRSVKKIHFGDVPEWVHTGGPRQIGHTVALNSESTGRAPLCGIQQFAGGDPARRVIRLEISAYCQSQWYFTTAAPRGPPRPCLQAAIS